MRLSLLNHVLSQGSEIPSVSVLKQPQIFVHSRVVLTPTLQHPVEAASKCRIISHQSLIADHRRAKSNLRRGFT